MKRPGDGYNALPAAPPLIDPRAHGHVLSTHSLEARIPSRAFRPCKACSPLRAHSQNTRPNSPAAVEDALPCSARAKMPWAMAACRCHTNTWYARDQTQMPVSTAAS
eukprot:scaffold77596_cov36-Tisochrysis_lutea.AAC.1